MRPWICCLLVLGAGLTAVGALPAAAHHMGSQAPNVAPRGPVHAPSLKHGFFRHHPFGPSGFGGPTIFPGGFFDSDVAPSFAAGAPPAVMLNGPPAAPPLPRRSAIEERPTVETTVDGIVIVRGPGSRHLGN